MSDTRRPRIVGFDLARFMAVFGFIAVDMVGRVIWADGGFEETPEGPAVLNWAQQMWWGRASAMLAVLAGTGLALFFRPGLESDDATSRKRVILRRGLFLLVVGHLWNSSTLWNWSILHYYPFYLGLGLLFVKARPRTLALAAALVVMIAAVDVFAFREMPERPGDEAAVEAVEEVETADDEGETAEDAPAAASDEPEEDWEGDFGDPKIWQAEFWSVRGHVVDTLFDGLYPLFPWMAFILIGMAVVRIGIDQVARRRRILGAALATLAVTYGTWWAARHFEWGETAALLTSVDRYPGLPLYILSAAAQAVVLLCLAFSVAEIWPKARWIAPLVATGQMTFSIYIFRIFIGGGDRDGLYDWIGFATGETRADLIDGWLRVAVFVPVMILVCHWWVRRFGRGPLEAAMRRFSDAR